jgi:hypothetical protein
VGHLDALQRLRVRSLLPEAPLFLRGDAPWPSWALHIEWRRVLTAGYRAPKQLRHTFASTMLSRNAPLLYVQKQGGWRSAAVLLRVYSRWLPPDVEAVSAPPSGTPAQPAAASAAHNARNSRRKGRNFQKHLAPTRVLGIPARYKTAARNLSPGKITTRSLEVPTSRLARHRRKLSSTPGQLDAFQRPGDESRYHRAILAAR